MNSSISGLAVCGAVLMLAVSRRPRPSRLIGEPRTTRQPGPVARLGRVARGRCRLEACPLGDTALGALLLAMPALALVSPVLPALAALAVLVQSRVAARRSRRGLEREVLRLLPDTVEMLLLCAGAGLALPLAHPLVAARVPPPVGPALLAADATAAGGRPRAEALLDALSPLGERSSALAHLLADHLRYGIPLRPGLERLSLELRLDRRRRAEEDARKVPVRLLAPLVTCILPAFGLLTVVPLLAASLQALPR